MVVTTVVAKKKAWPKLHDGTLVPLRKIDTPRSLARITLVMNSSRSLSARARRSRADCSDQPW